MWLGLAGASSLSSSSDSDEEGRSPGLATFWSFRAMAASFLALAAARRCSRVRVGLSGSEFSSSDEEESSSEEDAD